MASLLAAEGDNLVARGRYQAHVKLTSERAAMNPLQLLGVLFFYFRPGIVDSAARRRRNTFGGRRPSPLRRRNQLRLCRLSPCHARLCPARLGHLPANVYVAPNMFDRNNTHFLSGEKRTFGSSR